MNNEREPIAQVIDQMTGAILTDVYEGDKIIRKTDKDIEREKYIEEHKLNFNKGVSFVKTYAEASYILGTMLPPKECQFVMKLFKYVTYEECSLRCGYGKGTHYMDLNDISKELHEEYSRVSRLVSSLIKKGILGALEIGNMETNKKYKIYILNPYVCINGVNPAKEVYNYFEDSGWEKLLNEYYEQYIANQDKEEISD